jgi:NTP pyrophosphatase (non-canonical NTP hydrolase)
LELKTLQSTLREFAAEREWQPFHTPKNLAMALMVEAAELAEIFQWMTPEQSQATRGDLVLQEQVADEVADVLPYLVRIADHTGIDLKRAVGRKLVKNSKKHPPLRPGLPGFRVGTGAAGDTETPVQVDLENVQPKDADIRSLVPDVTDIWLFHGPNQKAWPQSTRHSARRRRR